MSLPHLPDVPRERRRTATVVAVGALGVLCLLALVLGLKGLFAAPQGATTQPSARGPSSAPTPIVSPDPGESSAQPSATSSTTAEPTDLVRFSSPSGNIRCVMSSAGARCDIASRTWKPPAKPASCHFDWAQGLVVSASGASFTCASDSAGGGSALAYGSSLTRGDVRCDSAKDGVTCTHRPSGHRFSLARASYLLR